MKRARDYYNGKLIDSHTHICGFDIYNFTHFRFPVSQDPIVLHDTLKENNIDCAITFPVAFTFYYQLTEYLKNTLFVPSGLCDCPYEIENKYLLKSIESYGYNNLLPFLSFSINDKINEQINVIRNLQKKYYIYGLKYHTMTDFHSAEELIGITPLIDFLKEYDMPLYFHSGNTLETNPISMLNFADAHPDIRICVAHIGRFNKYFFERLKSKDYNNVYFDIAPFSFLQSRYRNESSTRDLIKVPEETQEMLLWLIVNFENRILWGTDLPWISTGELNNDIVSLNRYSTEVNILNQLPHQLRMKIANINTLDFIFGRN